jgi:hypothetical protein
VSIDWLSCRHDCFEGSSLQVNSVCEFGLSCELAETRTSTDAVKRQLGL